MKSGVVVGIVMGAVVVVAGVVVIVMVALRSACTSCLPPETTRLKLGNIPHADNPSNPNNPDNPDNPWPLNLFLTYKSQDAVPQYMMDRFRRHAQGFRIEFYDDARCVQFFKDNFPPRVLKHYQSIRKGAHRADLWRYCALWLHGGVYLDIKIPLEMDLLDMFPNRRQHYTVLSAYPQSCFQAILVARKGDPVMHSAIQALLNTSPSELEKDYAIPTRDLHTLIHKTPEVRKQWHLFQERCGRCVQNQKPDKHNLCCTVYDPARNNLFLCKSRDPDFGTKW